MNLIDVALDVLLAGGCLAAGFWLGGVAYRWKTKRVDAKYRDAADRWSRHDDKDVR